MNRLASEKSPYLLQHAANPVDWYPWGDEAFDAARREDKPIFLSVGYSTCHWCHVMAHESFEDAGIAAVLNEHFIAIKVDREERPDIDRVYMAFVQATTGGGGWPMSVWLMPDLKPFHGGTYFPPTPRWGEPGFADLLLELARLWRDERSRVEQAAASVADHLAGASTAAGGADVPGTGALDTATREFLDSYDRRHGGFGGAPKFPRPSELAFLLHEHRRTGEQPPLDVVGHTLRAMAAGGMRDQVGGGFHRYSVDGQWRVPHFEKMLYDQAQLVLVCLEAAQATGDRFFIDVAEDTLQYVRRDMTGEDGGFWSAEDADSLAPDAAEGAHKAEGAFYLWTAREIEELLGPDAQVFCERYGVRPDGNALNDPQGEFTGRNILYQARGVDEIAGESGRSAVEVTEALRRSREVLFRAREDRPRPQRDDKVLTAWNGLMIAAFARASRVVAAMGSASAGGQGCDWAGDTAAPRGSSPAHCLTAARRAAAFIRDRLWDPATGRLLRRYRDGEAAIDACAEDYACLVFGLLELFQADGDPAWLAWAVELQQRQDVLFWDDRSGGWFSTSGQDGGVLLQLKDDYDGAEPAASSVGVLNLLVLSHLGALADEAASKVERTLSLFAPRLTTAPRAVPMMLAALSAWHAGLSEVVVVGPRGAADTEALRREVDGSYQPFVVVVPVEPDGGQRAALVRMMPSIEGMGTSGGRATAGLCRDFACQARTTEPAVLRRQLDR